MKPYNFLMTDVVENRKKTMPAVFYFKMTFNENSVSKRLDSLTNKLTDGQERNPIGIQFFSFSYGALKIK